MDRQRPDLIVSDLTLPTIEAVDFIRELRESEVTNSSPRVPALALTHANDEATVAEALRNGFQSTLAKPVQAVQLLTSLASLLRPLNQKPIRR